MFEALPRHAMVRPTDTAWSALLGRRPDLCAEPLLAGWVEAGYPLVARRPVCGESEDIVPLGLPLPPSHGKRRIALALAPEDILQAGPSPLLAEAASAAPAPWRTAIAELVRLDSRTRCFGSLAWQHLTGLAYVGESSDLDLLWILPGDGSLDRLLAGIAEIAQHAPMRIDGEIVAAAGGVNWCELQTGSSEILVKTRTDACLMTRAAFLAGECA